MDQQEFRTQLTRFVRNAWGRDISLPENSAGSSDSGEFPAQLGDSDHNASVVTEADDSRFDLLIGDAIREVIKEVARDVVRETVREEFRLPRAKEKKVAAEKAAVEKAAAEKKLLAEKPVKTAAKSTAEDAAFDLLNSVASQSADAIQTPPLKSKSKSGTGATDSAGKSKELVGTGRAPSKSNPAFSFPEIIQTEPVQPSRGPAVDDATLQSQIVDALANSGRPGFARITVSIRNGEVTLNGEVDNAEEKLFVAIYLQRVPGIVNLVDALRVSPRRSSMTAAPQTSASWSDVQAWKNAIREAPAAVKALAGLFVIAGVAGIVMSFLPPGPPRKVKVQHVAGKVLIEGLPAQGATISLVPTDPKMPKNVRPTGTIQPDGTFQVTTYEKNDGAPTGEYTAIVFSFQDPDGPLLATPPAQIPPVYGKPDTSPIKIKVADGSNSLQPLQLKQ